MEQRKNGRVSGLFYSATKRCGRGLGSRGWELPRVEQRLAQSGGWELPRVEQRLAQRKDVREVRQDQRQRGEPPYSCWSFHKLSTRPHNGTDAPCS